MKNLVVRRDGELRVSHRTIAENTNNNQKNINELIRKYENDFKEFGIIPFETEKLNNGAGRGQITYYLNEPQATLLMTYLRNSEVVRKFKKALVKEFYSMKEHINTKALYGKIGGLQNTVNKYKAQIEKQKALMIEHMSFDDKVDMLIKATNEELKNLKCEDRTDLFFKKRADYFVQYVEALRTGGDELQKFAIAMIDNLKAERNKYQDKYFELQQKYNSMKQCCNNTMVA